MATDIEPVDWNAIQQPNLTQPKEIKMEVLKNEV